MALTKTAEEIAIMREGGRILAHALEQVMKAVAPGITTLELDRVFEKEVRAAGAVPSFLGYRGYPNALCTSVNDEVVHGIPGNRTLKEGDIIGVDGGVQYKELFTDMARTIPVGEISEQAAHLIQITKEAFDAAVQVMKPGNTIGDIGATIQQHAEDAGYSVVRELVGHNVGHAVHEEPSIPNFGTTGSGVVLEQGMTLAIEPMVNIGDSKVTFDEDGWTVRVADGTLSAHFEDTIAITETGAEIITSLK